MAKFFDNNEILFTEALQGIIMDVGMRRVVFYVGYFKHL